FLRADLPELQHAIGKGFGVGREADPLALGAVCLLLGCGTGCFFLWACTSNQGKKQSDGQSSLYDTHIYSLDTLFGSEPLADANTYAETDIGRAAARFLGANFLHLEAAIAIGLAVRLKAEFDAIIMVDCIKSGLFRCRISAGDERKRQCQRDTKDQTFRL